MITLGYTLMYTLGGTRWYSVVLEGTRWYSRVLETIGESASSPAFVKSQKNGFSLKTAKTLRKIIGESSWHARRGFVFPKKNVFLQK